MTVETNSLAEETGLSFEKRCAGAKKALIEQWAALGKISAHDLSHLLEKRERYEQTATKSQNPVFQDLLKKQLKESEQIVADGTSQVLSTTWNYSLEVVRLMWGSDATDFALAAMKIEARNN
jgi:hypothetical protein